MRAMSRIRAHLTYVNVVGTIALFLALSGGAVWAANKITSKQIAKGAVKNKNLAKNAVKAKNLAKGSVTEAKLAKGAVKNANLADGSVNFAKLAAGTNVIATSSAGPLSIPPAEAFTPIPLNPPLSVTPVAGQPLSVSIEAHGTIVQEGGLFCEVFLFPAVNGNTLLIGELLALASAIPVPESPFPNGVSAAGVTFPLGNTQPGVAQSVTLQVAHEGNCGGASRIDQITAIVTQAK